MIIPLEGIYEAFSRDMISTALGLVADIRATPGSRIWQRLGNGHVSKRKVGTGNMISCEKLTYTPAEVGVVKQIPACTSY